MRNSRGVSLVEVLVSTVLLAVGIGGCLSALVGAARLRSGADSREALADAAESRLSWFEARGCLSPDTVLRSSSGSALTEEWHVLRDSAGAVITGEARVLASGRILRSTFTARRSCP